MIGVVGTRRMKEGSSRFLGAVVTVENGRRTRRVRFRRRELIESEA